MIKTLKDFRGKIIVFDGMDGSGKTEQSKLFVKALEERNVPVMYVDIPNYTSSSSTLVKRYLAKDYLGVDDGVSDNMTFVKQISSFYAVDRVSTYIEPIHDGKSLSTLLAEGYCLVYNRYSTSNMLHQSANLKNKSRIIEYLEWVEDLEYNELGLPRPDRVIFLDVLPEIAVENLKKRYDNQPKEDLLENIEHLDKVYKIKDMVISECGWLRVNCCPEKTLLPIPEVHQNVLATFGHIFNN